MDGKTDPKLWATVTVMIAVISCLGLVASAFIQTLPDLLKSRETSTVESAPSSNTPEIQIATPSFTTTPSLLIPTETVLPTAITNSDLSAKLYVLGYSSNDLAVLQAIANCNTCQVIYLSSVNDLPEDWKHHTFNIASPTENLSDGCRTKQDLIRLGVALMVANNYTPCSSGQSVTPVVTNCPSPSSYAISTQVLKPGINVTGPATIHPFDGSAELAKAVGIDWVPRWGINIPSGVSVNIPQTVTLLNGVSYTPDGTISVFSDESRMQAAQQCWLINNP